VAGKVRGGGTVIVGVPWLHGESGQAVGGVVGIAAGSQAFAGRHSLDLAPLPILLLPPVLQLGLHMSDQSSSLLHANLRRSEGILHNSPIRLCMANSTNFEFQDLLLPLRCRMKSLHPTSEFLEVFVECFGHLLGLQQEFGGSGAVELGLSI